MYAPFVFAGGLVIFGIWAICGTDSPRYAVSPFAFRNRGAFWPLLTLISMALGTGAILLAQTFLKCQPESEHYFCLNISDEVNFTLQIALLGNLLVMYFAGVTIIGLVIVTEVLSRCRTARPDLPQYIFLLIAIAATSLIAGVYFLIIRRW